jgi:hypothetical protein
MGDYRRSESKLMERLDCAANDNRPTQSSGHLVGKIVAGVAAGIFVYGLVISWQDIRRYIRMVRM